MKNSNDIIRNQTRDLLTCNAVPQPTAPPGAPCIYMGEFCPSSLLAWWLVSCHGNHCSYVYCEVLVETVALVEYCARLPWLPVALSASRVLWRKTNLTIDFGCHYDLLLTSSPLSFCQCLSIV